MARTAKTTKTEPVAEAATVEESAVAAVDAVEENANEETEVVEKKKTTTRARKTQTVEEEPLSDSDEIEVWL